MCQPLEGMVRRCVFRHQRGGHGGPFRTRDKDVCSQMTFLSQNHFVPPSRRGHTLTEVLVVIAIIGILLALLMPAVLQSMAAADRLSCENNLKQLSLALHSFHDANRSFPPGHDVRQRPWAAADHTGYKPYWSWMALTMPFYEQTALYDEAITWAQSGTIEEDRWWPWGNRDGTPPNPAFGTLNRVAQCPTDRRTFVVQDALGIRVALTSYLGISGLRADGAGDRSGVLYYNERVRFADIIDGVSNTLLIGERPPSADLHYGWWFAGAGYDRPPGSGAGDVVMGVREVGFAEYRECPPARVGLRKGQSGDPCADAAFWSFHHGGANFAMADGSIRFMIYDGNEVLPALATRNGHDINPHDF